MAEQIVIEIDDKISSSIENKLTGISRAAVGANVSIEILRKNLAVFDKNAIASERLALAQKKNEIASQQLAIATDRAAIAAIRLETAQKRAASGGRGLHDTYFKLGTLLRSFGVLTGVSVGIREILHLGNAYLDLQNKLRIVTSSQEQLENVSSRVFEISNKTRTSVEATAKSFARFDLALIQLGASQSESLRLTETINKAMIVSGAGTEEQAAGLLQLSQAFNKGKLDGDEFRSVMELMPTVADAIAKQLKVTRGELLKLAPQGKITAEVMRQALADAATDIDAKFAKTVPTLSQSLVVLKNNIIQTMGEFEKGSGTLSGMAKLIIDLSTYLETNSAKIREVGYSSDILFGSISNLLSALMLIPGEGARAANGFSILNHVIKGSGLIISVMSDWIRTATGDLAILTGALATTLHIPNPLKEWGDKTNNAKSSLDQFLDSVEKADLEMAKFEVKQENLKAIDDNLKNLTESSERLSKAMKAAPKLVSKEDRDTLKEIGTEIDNLTKKKNEMLGIRGPGASARKITDPNDVKNSETRARLLAKINAELNKETEAFGLLEPVRSTFLKMSEIEIRLADKKLAGGKLGIKLTEDERTALENKIRTIEKQKLVQAELEKINNDINGPLRQYNITLEASQMLLKEGAINQDQYNKTLQIAKNVYSSAIDPFKELNKNLAEESKLLEFVGQEHEIENRLQQIRNDLLNKGVILSGALEQEYRKEIEAIINKNELNKQQSAIYDELTAKGITFKAQLEALTALINGGANSLDLSTAKTTLFGSMFDGTEEAFDTQLRNYQIFYSQINQLRQKDLISEKTAFQLKMKADQKFNEVRLQGASEFFGSFAVLQNSGSRQLFEIGKAAAIAQATVDGIAGVQKALGSFPPPYSFAMAAAVGVVTAANVAKISSTPFGGGYENGGLVSGGEQIIRINEKGHEFVMNAEATARHRPVLEAMNSGKTVGNNVSVKIENYGTSKEFEVHQNDEGQIRIIARDEAREAIRRDVPSLVASEVRNPNSSTSKALAQNTSINRRRN